MTTPSLFTKEQREQLQANDSASLADESFAVSPVVKLFAPDGAGVWLLAELAADDDTAFGLCDLGFGCPELGTVSIRELATTPGKLGLPIERDLAFQPADTLDAYADRARKAGRIVA